MLSSPSGHCAFAAALLDPGQPAPAGLRAFNGSDVTARFAVYRNNVVVSLVGVLADTFPVVRQLVGEEFFGAMARAFVREHPPRSPVMQAYGDTFPAWLEAFEPAAALPYLADMARLEFARLRAFHAADAAAIEPAALAAALAEPQQIASMVLTLHPSLAVVASAHPVVSLWAAHQLEAAERDAALARIDLGRVTDRTGLTDGTDLTDAHPAGETALVLSQDDDALVLPVARADGELAQRLQAGQPLAAALAGSAAESLVALLALLLRHGAIVGLGRAKPCHDTASADPLQEPT